MLVSWWMVARLVSVHCNCRYEWSTAPHVENCTVGSKYNKVKVQQKCTQSKHETSIH